VLSAAGYALCFWIIVKQVVTGQTDVGSMVFLISIIGQLVGSIGSFLGDIAQLFERNQYANDIFKFFDTKPYVKRAKNPVPLKLKEAPTIEFRNVSFKYEDRPDWILRSINVTIKPGEKIALVGENGAGKSTFIKLLSRVYDPTEGEIFVNNIPLQNLDHEEWSSCVAVLLQDYLTYDFSVSDAIGMGRPSEMVTDRERAVRAAQLSGADEFIRGYQKGYDQQQFIATASSWCSTSLLQRSMLFLKQRSLSRWRRRQARTRSWSLRIASTRHRASIGSSCLIREASSKLGRIRSSLPRRECTSKCSIVRQRRSKIIRNNLGFICMQKHAIFRASY
jgi:ABC-type protease/lipase transport system fused ATPase/permease subunit